MPKLTFLAAAVPLLLGCATGAGGRSESVTPDVLRTVTGLSAISSGDLPTHYRRIHDLPGAKYMIWSYQHLCVVDLKIWMRAKVGDNMSCEWRMPR